MIASDLRDATRFTGDWFAILPNPGSVLHGFTDELVGG
jgi:hypothetical protein